MTIRNHDLAGILAAALFTLFIRPEIAMANPPMDAQAMLSAMFGYAMPTNPLKKGQKEIKIVPSYILGDNPVAAPPGGKSTDPELERNEKISGFGWAGAFVWGFSEHLGVSFLGAGMRESGTEDSRPPSTFDVEILGPVYVARNTYRNGKQEGRGYMGAVSLIYDPFKGDGFRLPFLLGVSMNSYSSEIVGKNAAGEELKEEASNKNAGILIGMAPQFNLRRIRVTPFAIVSMFPDNAKGSRTFYPATGPAYENKTSKFSGDTMGSAGIDLTYLPWGLGFTYIPDFSGVTAYTLKWTKKWGG